MSIFFHKLLFLNGSIQIFNYKTLAGSFSWTLFTWKTSGMQSSLDKAANLWSAALLEIKQVPTQLYTWSRAIL